MVVYECDCHFETTNLQEMKAHLNKNPGHGNKSYPGFREVKVHVPVKGA